MWFQKVQRWCPSSKETYCTEARTEKGGNLVVTYHSIAPGSNVKKVNSWIHFYRKHHKEQSEQ